MKNSVRFVSVESTLQPEQYSDEILLAYEEVCGFIEEHGESGYSAYKVVTAT